MPNLQNGNKEGFEPGLTCSLGIIHVRQPLHLTSHKATEFLSTDTTSCTYSISHTHVYPVTTWLQYVPYGFNVGDDVVSGVYEEDRSQTVPSLCNTAKNIQ